MTLKQYFENNPGITVTEVAKRAKINKTLFFDYMSGRRRIKEKRLNEVKQAIYELLDDAGRSAADLSR